MKPRLIEILDALKYEIYNTDIAVCSYSEYNTIKHYTCQGCINEKVCDEVRNLEKIINDLPNV